jgi:alkylhydroperoxidase family enzyme
MEFLRRVALLGDLDPLDAELVRLRGASQHQCRLCKSLRNRTAIEAGGNDDLFAAVDADRALLSNAQRSALALADAMIWTPGRLDPQVIEGIRQDFSPAGAVALVLWVTRNASNKIAVALAADAAHVSEGVEIYDLDARGEPVYGLTPA